MAKQLDVPVLPITRIRAVVALSTPPPQRETVGTLVQLAESDPQLTAAVIRTANSASSAPISRIDSARSAIVRIGPTEARLRMLAALVESTFDLADAGLDAAELSRHLIAVASITEGGAAGTWSSAGFTAGLLHDVGRMAMAAQHPDAYQQIVAQIRLGADVIEAEREQFGLTHIEWGARIARAWQLPEHVVLGIEHHHDAQGRGLGPIVHRAREVASRLGIGDGLVSPAEPEPDENSLSWLEAWDLRLHGDDWAWRAVRATGGIRALAQRMGLNPQGPARAA